MVMIGVMTAAGNQSSVEVARDDLIAEVKARIVDTCFPVLRGQMITVTYRGMELPDEKSMADFKVHDLNHMRLMIEVNMRQPYAPINYHKVASALVKEGYKKTASHLAYSPEEWDGTWSKGDEYKSYPPVDVDNPFSVIPPSSSRELAQIPHGSPSSMSQRSSSKPVPYDLPERAVRRLSVDRNNGAATPDSVADREKKFRDARQVPSQAQNKPKTHVGNDNFTAGRSISNTFFSSSRGCKYLLMHLAEGTWQGETLFSDAKFKQNTRGPHLSSSKVMFNPSLCCWTDKQLITNSDGVSTTHTLRYYAQSDGLLHVQTDEGVLQNANAQLREVGSNVMILTATSENGSPLLTEVITFSTDFGTRVRSGQRFAADGELLATYVCTEHKYVDNESGALEKIN
mmetsp:Transcript_19877/g.35333  ORF Transcript_19877/g.35333 Transcript_19877/m.35333 type:complete len:400 (-) Transcript_19877:30-1229(-)